MTETRVQGQRRADVDGWLVVAATAAGSISLGMVPVMLGLFSTQLGLDRLQASYIASSESAGVLVGTALAMHLAMRGSVAGGMVVGAIVGAAASLLTLLAMSDTVLMAVRFLCGAGVGLILGLGNHSLGQGNLPERGFARLNLLQGILSASASVGLPWLVEACGYPYAFVLLAACFALVLLAAGPFTRVASYRLAQVPRQQPRRLPARPGLMALGALACFEFGAIAFWSSVHAFGAAAGMPPRSIGLAVGAGGIGTIAAGLVGSGIGSRWGRLPLQCAAFVLICIALLLMARPGSLVQFAFALLFFNMGWTTGLIYGSGLVASLADSATLTAALAFTIVASAAMAPATTALMTQGSLPRVLLVCAFASVLSLVLAFAAARARNRAPST